MTLSIIILLLIAARSVVITNQQSDWIDPHDMNNGKDFFRDNTEFVRPTQAQCETKLPSDCPPTLSLSHYKRLISLILNLVKLDEASSYSGRLTLRLSTADYKFLLGFIRESGDVENVVLLRKIEQVMSRVMTKSRWEHAADLLVTWTDSLYFNFFNRTTAITATCMLVLVISYKLLKASFTIWLVMKCLILLGWIVDFGFRWMSLIQVFVLPTHVKLSIANCYGFLYLKTKEYITSCC
uniref:Chloride channel CLIC-like protein 1 n=1 Tax=Photinus pyralis TaxID=7054 RepID=A0A1Y1JVY2_PHOPY